MQKTALVTGGAGFIGSHLCERLLGEGFRVVAVDSLLTGSLENLASFKENPAFTFVERDVRDATEAEFASCKFDEIYNLACPASPVHYQADPLRTALTSIKGILLSLSLARRDGAKLLHASTSEIYGDPLQHPQKEEHWGNVNTIGIRSCYDEGKRMAETLLCDHIRTYGTDARMVRIFNTYGPRMHPQDGRVVSNFIVQALADADITIYGDGSQTRSFQFVSDLIEAMRKYMALGKDEVRAFFSARGFIAPVINTGNPDERTVKELAERTLALIPESKSKIVLKPLPGDDPKRRKPDISLAKTLLGWEPRVTLDEGLAKTVEYFKARKETSK